MGTALYEHGSAIYQMHHIRNPTDEDFVYDPRSQPLEDPVLKVDANFGNDGLNIPEFGVGNCQDWVAAAVGMLEMTSVVEKGEGDSWTKMINKSSEEMKNACLQAGKQWIDGPESVFEGEPDANFKDAEKGSTRAVGKLAQNEDFKARMQALLGNGNEGKEEDGRKSKPVERPFYVYSPFFSRMGDKKD
ncbi:hypothetical protein BJX70DRAFT_394341 [Aspergillus crustosus]